MLKDMPRYECLLEASRVFPQLDPDAVEAYLHLLRAGDEVIRASSNYFARKEMSSGRFSVLMLLLDPSKGTPLKRTPAELAELTNCTRATMTGLVDTLEKDGMVRREPNPDDRRMMSVVITDAGIHLMHGILPEHFSRISRLMGSLSDRECKQLVGLLAKVLDQINLVEPPHADQPSESGAGAVKAGTH